MVERYPKLKEEVSSSIPGCEISSLLDKKLVMWSTTSCAWRWPIRLLSKKKKKKRLVVQGSVVFSVTWYFGFNCHTIKNFQGRSLFQCEMIIYYEDTYIWNNIFIEKICSQHHTIRIFNICVCIDIYFHDNVFTILVISHMTKVRIYCDVMLFGNVGIDILFYSFH